MNSKPSVAADRERTLNCAGKSALFEYRSFWMVAITRCFCVSVGSSPDTPTGSSPSTDNFGFGCEMGRIGAAIASGVGFSDPFDGRPDPLPGNRRFIPI